MESGSYSVIYGTQAKIYYCFNGVMPANLQVRNSRGAWKNMQTVTTKKSKRCDDKRYQYVALFNGRVTALGQQLDDGLYLEMRLTTTATRRWSAYRSAPALIPQYKSRADQIGQLGDAFRDALANL